VKGERKGKGNKGIRYRGNKRYEIRIEFKKIY